MGNLRRFFVVWTALLFGCSVAGAESVRPNVILIFTDDHGWADLGVHDVDADIRTPHTDQLARAMIAAMDDGVAAIRPKVRDLAWVSQQPRILG